MNEADVRQEFVAALEAGQVCELPRGENEQPAEVRAGLLRELLLDPQSEIHRQRGARFRGCHVVGRLVLSSHLLRFPLEFDDCTFDDDLVLERARLRSLTLHDCELGLLRADRLRCFGGIDLRRSKLAALRLRGAVVRGSLRLDHGRLAGAEVGGDSVATSREAVSAEGAVIRGEVSMRLIEAGATVNLRRSVVGLRLSALGARVDGRGELALRLEEATVERNVDLKFGFEARGGVHMERIRIGGNLDCRGARLVLTATVADLRDALSAHDARIGGDVMLKAGMDGEGERRPFEAIGSVNLFRARIGGSLECHGARFVALGRRGRELKRALDCEELQLTGSALLKVYDPAEDSNRRFRREGDQIGSLRCRTSGAVSFRRARLGRRLSCSGAIFNEDGGGPLALLADDAMVERNVDLRRDALTGLSFVAHGTVDLDRISVGGSLDCGGGQFEADFHAERTAFTESSGSRKTPDHGQRCRALAMRDARVTGSVYLSAPKRRDATEVGDRTVRSFHAIGRVSLARCEIGGAVSLRRAHFERRLDAEPAVDEGTPNCLKLNDARIAGYLDLDDALFEGSCDAGGGARAGIPAVSVEARGLEIEGMAWLTHRVPGDAPHDTDCKLLFEGAQVGKVLNHPRTSWPRRGRLAIDGLRYEKLELWRSDDGFGRDDPRIWSEWLALQFGDREADGFAAQPHEQLIAVLRSMGLPEEARRLAIDKREREIGTLPAWARWLYRVLLRPIGYGHRPWAALKYLAVLYVLGVVIFSLGWHFGAIEPAPLEVLVQRHIEATHSEVFQGGHELPAEAYPEFNAFVYSADTFLPIIDLHQESYWLPRRQPRPDRPAEMAGLLRGGYWVLDGLAANWCRFYLWLHIAAGWVLVTITIAGLTGIVKSD